MPVTPGLLTVTRSHQYLAIAQDGTELRAFLYGAAGQHLSTLGVIDTAANGTVFLGHTYLFNAATPTLWMTLNPALAISETHEYYNWTVSGSGFTAKDTSPNPDGNFNPRGAFWRSSPRGGSIWRMGSSVRSTEQALSTWASDADCISDHDWNPTNRGSCPTSWEPGDDPLSTTNLATNTIPTRGAVWTQVNDTALYGSDTPGAGASNFFAYAKPTGSILAPHTGTVFALNPDLEFVSMTAAYLTPGHETAHGGISVLNRVSTGKDVVAHVPAFANVGATGTLTQVALTPSSWNITGSAAHSLHVSPDGTAFVWYDPTAKKFVRHSTNPADAIAEADDLAARQVAVEDAPGAHAIDCLIPLT